MSNSMKSLISSAAYFSMGAGTIYNQFNVGHYIPIAIAKTVVTKQAIKKNELQKLTKKPIRKRR